MFHVKQREGIQMASYTMQLREYIEQVSQYESLPIREQIEKGRAKLFDFDYPIFDAAYKNVFETHFIRNFYMREIGFETEGLFKFQLENWLTIHMPYFNKLFESELKEFDIFSNFKIDTTQKKTIDRDQTQDTTTDGTNKSTSTGNVTSDSFGRDLASNNPDSRLAITTQDGAGVIQYASAIDEATKKTTNDSTGEVNDTTNVIGNAVATLNEVEDYIESKIGKVGNDSYSKMLNDYRSTLLRIEKQIFKEMQELFMLVY
jgi:hypothetical protein